MKLKWDFHELYDFGKRISNVSKFEKACKDATRELAKVFHQMLISNTPLLTGKLKSGWDGKNLQYKVKQTKDGFEVEFINDVPYAWYVNYGHYSYNQFNVGGEPWVVHNRIKVPKRSKYDDLDIRENNYVFGHFFVEKSIVQLENSSELNKVLQIELEKWFRWCVNGK